MHDASQACQSSRSEANSMDAQTSTKWHQDTRLLADTSPATARHTLTAPLPQEADAGTGDAFLQSLARGLAVLTAFRPGQERLIIAQVARTAGLTRAGARRILLTLEHLGYVATDKRQFFLTPQVLDLVAGYSARPIWETARKVLQSVAAKLNETVSAGVLDGTEVVYTVRVRSSHFLHLDVKEGARVPAHASSMGRIFLAALPPSSLRQYFRNAELKRYTSSTITDPDTLRKRLESVREQGWCAVRDEIEEGITGVSVPLTDPAGRTIAALNVSISSQRATAQMIGKTIVPVLREAVQTVVALL
jgi:IclR family pca regulon transcriptional regulator